MSKPTLRWPEYTIVYSLAGVANILWVFGEVSLTLKSNSEFGWPYHNPNLPQRLVGKEAGVKMTLAHLIKHIPLVLYYI